MSVVRPPAVAGMFYPADPRQLEHDVQKYLAAAQPQAFHPNGQGKYVAPDDGNRLVRFPHPNPPPQGAPKVGNPLFSKLNGELTQGTNESLGEFHVKALIAPHAGYIYSGAIAASAYASLQTIAPRICRVILLGPTHRVAVRGLALPDTDAFDTPLGQVQLDSDAMHTVAKLPQVTVSGEAHEQEHSLEVQLPFLQSVLGKFTLLPLAVGMATAEEVAEVLEAVWGGDETLIVISSDLSHYLPYATAQFADNKTAQDILNLHQPIDHEQACGGTPISGLLLEARRHHLTPHLLDLRNSGDTAGSHDRVVGYAAFAFTGEKDHVRH